MQKMTFRRLCGLALAMGLVTGLGTGGVFEPLAFGQSSSAIRVGTGSIDGWVVHWVGTGRAEDGSPANLDAIRTTVTVEPIQLGPSPMLNLLFGGARVLPMDATVSYVMASGQFQLTRARASLLRAVLLQRVPTELLTVYRDTDRGITVAGDIFSLRVPVRLTRRGEIVILPGMEMGFRYYGERGHDTTAFHTSFVLEARAAYELVQGWLSTGILARIRGDLVTDGYSAHEEMAQGFLALALDERNQFFARIYGGVEHDSLRSQFGLPDLNVFAGLGIYGNLGGR
jgi:hypothetical protein